tara:strand:- start:7244 stop:7708 length:465 start_codon:yes stop_codon:yes gene_type:complete
MSNLLLENYIKYIIKNEPINTLHIYDFDMTLYDHEKEDWIMNIVAELQNSLKDPQTRVILCTARTNKTEHIMSTEELLNQNNMSLNDFDQCYFKSEYRKEKAPIYKSHVILDEICANDNIAYVKFWDDREDTLEQVRIDLERHNSNIEYTPVKC